MTHDEKLIQAALGMAADVAMDRAYRLLSLAEDAERGGNFALGDRIRVLLTVAEDTAASVRSITPAKVLTKVGRDTARRDHLTNGPARLWMQEGTSAPWFVKPAGNSTEYVRADLSPAPDAVARLVEAANQARLALAGYVSAQSAIDKLDEALAAMKAGADAS